MLDSIIRYRFRIGVGSEFVATGSYELFNPRKRETAIEHQDRLLPGSDIIMAVIIGKTREGDVRKQCPMNRCRSTRITPYFGGGWTWYEWLHTPMDTWH
jgi:hypothetical protein